MEWSFFGRESGMAGGRISGGPGGPIMPWCSQALAALPCGVVAWWVPLGCPRCLSNPFQTKKIKNNFLEFFEKFIFKNFHKLTND
jgi:hypothetical protein